MNGMDNPYVIMAFMECDEEKVKELANMLDLLLDKNLGRNGYTIEVEDTSTREQIEF